MQCPKNHGEMDMYKQTSNTENYICKKCSLRIKYDTETGYATEVAYGIAAIGEAVRPIFAAIGVIKSGEKLLDHLEREKR